VKKTIRLIGIIALITVIGFTMAACDDSGDRELIGTIEIVAGYNNFTVGTYLTARFLAPIEEQLKEKSYQWKRDGINIPEGANGQFDVTEPGSYTVTVSIKGYKSKTSAPVIVTSAE